MIRTAVTLLTVALLFGGASGAAVAAEHGIGHPQHARIDHSGAHHRHDAHRQHGSDRDIHRILAHSLHRRAIHSSLRHHEPHQRNSSVTSYAYPTAAPQGWRQVSKIGWDSRGRRARIGSTLCYGEDGRAYIAEGSRYVIAYLP